ncbi:MAG: deoxycytidylate deaminase [Bacteriovoracia bacterium]
MESKLNWDEYFMLQAVVASFKSKDPSTKVGCVFVDSKNHQVSMGYNGQVAGIDETQISWNKSKELPLDQQKYAYVVHSEANAILHAKGNLEGTRLYVTLFPCNECAKLIATVRIKEVIYLSDKYNGTIENAVSKKILAMSGITTRQLSLRSSLMDELGVHLKKTLSDV